MIVMNIWTSYTGCFNIALYSVKYLTMCTNILKYGMVLSFPLLTETNNHTSRNGFPKLYPPLKPSRRDFHLYFDSLTDTTGVLDCFAVIKIIASFLHPLVPPGQNPERHDD